MSSLSSKNDQEIAPGVDEEWYEAHDLMNLATLPFVIFSNVMYQYYESSKINFWLQFWIFAGYLIIDAVWIFFKPQSVVTPWALITHHFITLVVWCIPLIWGMYYAQWCAILPLIEITTWLMIARRYFPTVPIFTPLFWVSWIVLRVFYYTFQGMQFVMLTKDKFISSKGHLDGGAIAYTMMWSLFATLNLKWTFDLTKERLFDYLDRAESKPKGA